MLAQQSQQDILAAERDHVLGIREGCTGSVDLSVLYEPCSEDFGAQEAVRAKVSPPPTCWPCMLLLL